MKLLKAKGLHSDVKKKIGKPTVQPSFNRKNIKIFLISVSISLLGVMLIFSLRHACSLSIVKVIGTDQFLMHNKKVCLCCYSLD